MNQEDLKEMNRVLDKMPICPYCKENMIFKDDIFNCKWLCGCLEKKLESIKNVEYLKNIK